MKVKALRSFNDHQPGDEFECEEATAAIFVRQGLVQRLAPEPETATAPQAEEAVSRRGKR